MKRVGQHLLKEGLAIVLLENERSLHFNTKLIFSLTRQQWHCFLLRPSKL